MSEYLIGDVEFEFTGAGETDEQAPECYRMFNTGNPVYDRIAFKSDEFGLCLSALDMLLLGMLWRSRR